MTVLFDTATLQPADRPDSWNDAHRRIFLPIGVRFTEADTLSGRIEQQELGPVRAFRIFSEPSVIERSVAEVRSFDPGDFLVGHCCMERDRAGVAGDVARTEKAGATGLLDSRPPARARPGATAAGAHRQPAPGLATACGRPYSPPQGSSERRA